MHQGNVNNSGQSDDRRSSPRRPRYRGTHPRRYEERYKELHAEQYPGISEHIRAQGRTPAGTHVPVMLAEVLAALRPAPGQVAVDATVGFGGHSAELSRRIQPGGLLLGLDVDAAQLQRTAERLGGSIRSATDPAGGPPPGPIRLHRSHFGGVGNILSREGVDGCDILFADLGVSSMQIDDPARGFSYKHEGPLDMRMDDRLKQTAADLLAELSCEELSRCLLELGDEPDHQAIAEAIVKIRAREPITRTRQLVRLIESATGRRRRAKDSSGGSPSGRLHPAARTFQALRMVVNDEVGGLVRFMQAAPWCLRPGGRLAVISFHSGEHRRIEAAFAEHIRLGLYSAVCHKPVSPSPAEVRANPRSRSAQLRWAIRTA